METEIFFTVYVSSKWLRDDSLQRAFDAGIEIEGWAKPPPFMDYLLPVKLSQKEIAVIREDFIGGQTRMRLRKRDAPIKMPTYLACQEGAV